MRTRTLTAAAVSGLLLTAVLVPEEGAGDAGGVALLQSDDEPPVIDQGGATCDVEPGPDPFYTYEPEYSASKTYDDRFAQLDEQLPYLRGSAPEWENWTPQGLAHWPDWDGRGNDALLVTAYRDGDYARIYSLDPETGALLGAVEAAESHVGGIAILRDWAFVSGQTEDGRRKYRKYDLNELRAKLLDSDPEGAPSDQLPNLDDRVGEPAELDLAYSSFMGTDGTTLYIGEYFRGNEDTKRAYMGAFSVGESGELDLQAEYGVPLGAQGVTVVGGDFVFSVAPDRTETAPPPGEQPRKGWSYLYTISAADMAENLIRTDSDGFDKATSCYRAPAMSEGIATAGDRSYLLFESGSQKFDDNSPVHRIEEIHVGRVAGGGGGEPGDGQTSTTYTGPTEADYHDSFTASAKLAGDGPVSGARLDFALGEGGGSQSCSGTTDSAGDASCTLTPNQKPGPTTLTVRFGGGDGLQPSTTTVPFTISKQETALAYTGPKRVANGTPAHLSGVLTEENADGPTVSGREVTLSLGTGDSRQECTGTTNGEGIAECTIDEADQPLNDDATVPVGLDFTGDDYYEKSSERATVLLEYYTGRSYGISVDGLLGIEPTPDTGQVRTAQASRHDPGCAVGAGLALVRAGTLCPEVVTSLAPGTSKATTTVQDASIGLPGLPLIELSGVTARSTSTCASGGSASGSVDLTLRVGGELVEVTGEPNAVVELPGAARLVINEQLPVPGADHGRTVNAVRIEAGNGTADVVIASATSDVHNCA
ncbi:choice-of-anchor P family protein [Saccharopolyspora indica]|uniref:choice-of-anchor P family protein n=1 Tax=Saccharopolyspora indica TaxID=1229659 RepID=UPI002FE651A3